MRDCSIVAVPQLCDLPAAVCSRLDSQRSYLLVRALLSLSDTVSLILTPLVAHCSLCVTIQRRLLVGSVGASRRTLALRDSTPRHSLGFIRRLPEPPPHKMGKRKSKVSASHLTSVLQLRWLQ